MQKVVMLINISCFRNRKLLHSKEKKKMDSTLLIISTFFVVVVFWGGAVLVSACLISTSSLAESHGVQPVKDRQKFAVRRVREHVDAAGKGWHEGLAGVLPRGRTAQQCRIVDQVPLADHVVPSRKLPSRIT